MVGDCFFVDVQDDGDFLVVFVVGDLQQVVVLLICQDLWLWYWQMVVCIVQVLCCFEGEVVGELGEWQGCVWYGLFCLVGE